MGKQSTISSIRSLLPTCIVTVIAGVLTYTGSTQLFLWILCIVIVISTTHFPIKFLSKSKSASLSSEQSTPSLDDDIPNPLSPQKHRPVSPSPPSTKLEERKISSIPQYFGGGKQVVIPIAIGLISLAISENSSGCNADTFWASYLALNWVAACLCIYFGVSFASRSETPSPPPAVASAAPQPSPSPQRTPPPPPSSSVASPTPTRQPALTRQIKQATSQSDQTFHIDSLFTPDSKPKETPSVKSPLQRSAAASPASTSVPSTPESSQQRSKTKFEADIVEAEDEQVRQAILMAKLIPFVPVSESEAEVMARDKQEREKVVCDEMLAHQKERIQHVNQFNQAIASAPSSLSSSAAAASSAALPTIEELHLPAYSQLDEAMQQATLLKTKLNTDLQKSIQKEQQRLQELEVQRAQREKERIADEDRIRKQREQEEQEAKRQQLQREKEEKERLEREKAHADKEKAAKQAAQQQQQAAASAAAAASTAASAIPQYIIDWETTGKSRLEKNKQIIQDAVAATFPQLPKLKTKIQGSIGNQEALDATIQAANAIVNLIPQTVRDKIVPFSLARYVSELCKAITPCFGKDVKMNTFGRGLVINAILAGQSEMFADFFFESLMGFLALQSKYLIPDQIREPEPVSVYTNTSIDTYPSHAAAVQCAEMLASIVVGTIGRPNSMATRAWTWLSRFCNQKPTPFAGNILCTFLGIAGFSLYKRYGPIYQRLQEYILGPYHAELVKALQYRDVNKQVVTCELLYARFKIFKQMVEENPNRLPPEPKGLPKDIIAVDIDGNGLSAEYLARLGPAGEEGEE